MMDVGKMGQKRNKVFFSCSFGVLLQPAGHINIEDAE